MSSLSPIKKLMPILLLYGSSLFAETTPYVVTYLGVPIIDMVKTETRRDSLVLVQYDNRLRGFFSNVMDLHNVYRVSYEHASFRPVTWSKRIQEGELQFELNASKIPGRNEVRYSDGTTRNFPNGSFTVFSATHYLESIALEADQFPKRLDIFIDGEQWSAQVNRWSDAEHSHLQDHPPGTVLLRAVLHRKGGSSVVAQNDILTKHIASEGSLFLLWVDQSGRIIRARFGTFPMAVELDLVDD